MPLVTKGDEVSCTKRTKEESGVWCVTFDMRETVWILPGVRVKELRKPLPCTRGPEVFNQWWTGC